MLSHLLVSVGACTLCAWVWPDVIDEVRLADTARSADWIRAQHLSMTDAFLTYGGEESRRVE